MGFFKRSGFLWCIKSDIELRTTTIWGLDKKERIDGFYFLSKKPLSKSYQWHATIGLESTYKILGLIRSAIKRKEKAIQINISSGFGKERVVIHKGSLLKAERLMFEMIREIQEQY